THSTSKRLGSPPLRVAPGPPSPRLSAQADRGLRNGSGGMVKQAGVVAWLVGIAALVALTVWCGLEAVGHAIVSIGWGILLVVLVRSVTVAVAGAGWWLLFPAKVRPQPGPCLFLRFIREAINVLLPVAQVGGDVIGARLLTTYAVPGALAAAS